MDFRPRRVIETRVRRVRVVMRERCGMERAIVG